MPIATINPATGETLRTFTPLTASELEARLACADSAYRRHRRTTFAERRVLMLKAAEILESEKEAFGRLMVTEMGKPLKAGIEEAAKSALGCRYYAENAERFLADEPIETSATKSWVAYQPIGPVLAVMPWNFPFWQVFRFAAPALMAGNVGLLKHASNVPQCALAIEDIFRRAGFPEGCFQTLLIETDQVKRVIEDPRVAAVTLTGSTNAGSHVASAAGKVIKKSVLELGGSDPFVVMPSADLEAAVRTAVKARTINNGQSCIAAKRFIVAESIAEEFERKLRRGIQGAQGGRPDGPGHRHRAARQREPGADDRRAGTALGRRWGQAPDRRQAARQAGLLVRADRADQRHARVAGVLRRGLRSRGDPVPRPHRGRRHPAGQRLPLRARRERLDQRRRRSGSGSWRRSRPGWCSSTPWWPRIRGCRSAA